VCSKEDILAFNVTLANAYATFCLLIL